LENVFEIFTGYKDYFTTNDIARVLKFLDYPLPKSKIDLMIWVLALIRKSTTTWIKK